MDCPPASLGQILVSERKQATTTHGNGIRNIYSTSDSGFGIAEYVGPVPGDRSRITEVHTGRRQVHDHQTSVGSAGDAGTSEVRVGVVAHDDALAPAVGHNKAGARVQGRAVANEHRAAVASIRLPGVVYPEFGTA